MRTSRREAVAVAVGVLLVVAAFVVPHLDLGIVTPLINATPGRLHAFADTAPIFGWFQAHVGWGTVPAVLIGAAAVLWGPAFAQRLPWRVLPWVTWATACAWAFSLAMIDGWQRGFAGRLTARHEYLRQVPTVTDIPEAVRTFADRILDYQPDSWITHVSGHPPGALLTFVWLDRIGLGGGAWAALLCLLVGSSAATAILVAVRALAGEQTARLAAPFVAVAPTAIWIAVSADGYFAGVAAWGIALLALAVRATGSRSVLAASGAGLLLGWGIFLNYGLVLMALPAVAVLVCASSWRSALRVLVPAVVAAVVVVVVFAAAGFWWYDGYLLVQERYWQGIANDRPFQYWSWANLAAVVCAVGLGSVAGIGRVFDIAAIRRRSGLHLVVIGVLLAIAFADLSMLSKAETERIWLPFTVWLPAAAALLPQRSHRWWLALNVVGALALNHLILTNW
ncbi:membrane protein [Mycolicibacterium elephantis]|uniref:membrane protein n=1 Tax=Mycolicibacterium elephantis TaxID=81858 RepID=UPI000629A299|nr:membrane protein [Mycolicibacterium elephantis]KKW63249.1 membrane protein [Mycolicibacterium elephantis]